MKTLSGIIYIEFSDFIAAGWKEDSIKKSNLRNGNNWQMIKNPADKRMPMVRFDTLVSAHQAKIHAWLRLKNKCKHADDMPCNCGDPYEYMAKEPIRQMVTRDFNAHAFYTGYEISPQKSLPTDPINYIEKYTVAASWLNMLIKVQANKKEIKKNLNLSWLDFWKHVSEIIRTDDIDLPTATQRLQQCIDNYKAQGYTYLISDRFNNKAAAKINDQLSEGTLLSLIEHPNQYDDVLVAYLYNKWAVENGYKQITAGTVFGWRHKKECEITISRYGNEKFNEKFIRQVKGFAPTNVNMLWESDDYNLNYYYRDPNADSSNKDMHRYVSYIVADSKTGLVLGKSYRQAKSPIVEMARLAYIDAMYYVRSLTGDWYLPFEVKADHWQSAILFPFFKRIANFVPPAVGNKHRGYIEQLFGSVHAKRAEKIAANRELNYNGNNITAANRGVNVETLNLSANRKARPQVGETAERQIEKFFHYMRRMPQITRDNMEGFSKQEEWMNNWRSLKDEDKRQITDEQFLMMFGFEHKPQGRTNRITNRGVEPQINGIQYSYDLPESVNLLYNIGKQVTIYYDPYDMSRVLVTNGEGFREIAHSATLQPRALHDAHVNSRAVLNFILNEKVQQVNHVTDKAALRDAYEFDSEAVLYSGFMPKELKNSIEENAEIMLANQTAGKDEWDKKRLEYLESETDFDKYFTQS